MVQSEKNEIEREELEVDGDVSRFTQHIDQLRDLLRRYRDGTLTLGRRPDDLIEVLSLIVVGGHQVLVHFSDS